jgi:hypothetical protein
MKNCIKVSDKLGYLNPKNGRYKYVEIVAMDSEKLTMLEVQKVGCRKIDNIYNEQLPNVINWIKESSLNFADGRKLIKHKSSNSLVMSEAATRYNNILNSKN